MIAIPQSSFHTEGSCRYLMQRVIGPWRTILKSSYCYRGYSVGYEFERGFPEFVVDGDADET
jgi:hypothetical protein